MVKGNAAGEGDYRYGGVAMRDAMVMVVGLLAWAGVASAEIYMYKGADGSIYFTDSPSANQMDRFGAKPLGHYSTAKRSRSTDAYDAIILRASKKHHLPFSLIKAVIHAESSFNPKARSPKGAMGLMQLMPKNSAQLKVVDPYDPYENIMGGCAYLKRLMDRYNGDLTLTLAAYNAGPSKVKKFNGVPPYTETRDYILKVERFKKIYTN